MTKIPASNKLLRLISARFDMCNGLEAFTAFRELAGTNAGEYSFFAMAIAYGRPFTNNHGLGSIKCEFPQFPDFEDPDMNLRHQRLLDLRNKFIAHSSVEGTRVLVVPPGVPDPGILAVRDHFEYYTGKRTFFEPAFAAWLVEVVFAFKGRLDTAVRSQLQAEFGKQTFSSTVELETGWEDFKWTPTIDGSE